MSFHTVEMAELEDFTFDRVVCSSWPKKLVVYVHPAKGAIHFKLYYKDEPLGTYNSLDVALLDYNDIASDKE